MNIVDHTVVPNSQAVSVVLTHELLTSGGTWIGLQGFDARHNPRNPLPVDPPKVFGSRLGNLNAVRGHRRTVVS